MKYEFLEMNSINVYIHEHIHILRICPLVGFPCSSIGWLYTHVHMERTNWTVHVVTNNTPPPKKRHEAGSGDVLQER